MLAKRKFNYSPRTYSNPFFQAKKRRVRNQASVSWKNKLIALSILIIFFALSWFMFFSNFFTIKQITVIGSDKISLSNLENTGWMQTENKRFFASQNNIFLFDKNGLRDSLENQYKFKRLEIEKKLPATIRINIEEPSYSAMWLEEGKYYYIDNGGDLTFEAVGDDISQRSYPLFENTGDMKFSEKKAGEGPKISYAMELLSIVNEKHIFEIERFLSDNDANSIKLALKDGPAVIFNINEDKNSQLSKLQILIKEKLKDDFKTKSYIDLRYGDKVYYK